MEDNESIKEKEDLSFIDNVNLAVLTSARREDDRQSKCKTSTGSKTYFRSP